MKILLIDHDYETSGDIVFAFNGEGHEVTVCHDGLQGLAKAREGRHAAIIVNRVLPGLDGLLLVKQLRAEGIGTPVLFLASQSELDDRVEGLMSGADDYLTKPFAFPELLARVYAVTRRNPAEDAEPVRLRVADLEMDLIRRTVYRAGKAVELQAQEFRLLEYLMRNTGRSVTHSMLLRNVWDLDFDPKTNLVATHISRLRDKVDRDHSVQLIHTVRGTGYVLRE